MTCGSCGTAGGIVNHGEGNYEAGYVVTHAGEYQLVVVRASCNQCTCQILPLGGHLCVHGEATPPSRLG